MRWFQSPSGSQALLAIEQRLSRLALFLVSIPIGKSGPFSQRATALMGWFSPLFQSPSGSQALLAEGFDFDQSATVEVSIPIGKSGPFSRFYTLRNRAKLRGFNPHREVRPF